MGKQKQDQNDQSLKCLSFDFFSCVLQLSSRSSHQRYSEKTNCFQRIKSKNSVENSLMESFFINFTNIKLNHGCFLRNFVKLFMLATAYVLTLIKLDTYYILFNDDIQIIIPWKMFSLTNFSLKYQGIFL